MSFFAITARGDVIELEDGRTVWYPDGPLKQGHVLDKAARRAVARSTRAGIILVLAWIALPGGFLIDRLSEAFGRGTAIGAYTAGGVFAIILFAVLIALRPLHLMRCGEKRNPDERSGDIDRIQTQSEKGGAKSKALAFFFLGFLGAVILEGLLEGLLS